MTAERLYAAHRAVSEGLGFPLPPWDELSWIVKDAWEDYAVEQGLRDQPECGTLPGRIDE